MTSKQISKDKCCYIIHIEEMENMITKFKNHEYVANLQFNFKNGLKIANKLHLPILNSQHCSLCNSPSMYAIIYSFIPDDVWKWSCENHFDYFYDNAIDNPIMIISPERFEIHNVM